MDQDRLKIEAAQAALEHVKQSLAPNSILGIGTGSTVNCFIDLLPQIRNLIRVAVSSSQRSTERLQRLGIPVSATHLVNDVDAYVDGADEVDPSCALIKGGGGALTQEKIVTSIARRFICIVDQSKLVDRLGSFPLPVEVIPAAKSAVGRFATSLGGTPSIREDLTENGNVIVDIQGLEIDDPDELEKTLNNVAGVVTVGIFAKHRPNVVVVAETDGSISTMEPNTR